MLKLSNISVYYGQSPVLKSLNMEIKPGEIVALIGSNGAGKNTLMSALAGLTPVRQGVINFQDRDITNKPPQKVVALGISLVPERREIFDALTVKDNLLLGSYHRYHRDRKSINADLTAVLDTFPTLKGKEKRLAGSLSGGEQQMLAIGRSLMAKPKLLLLDEPSIGLAPLIVQEIFRILHRLRERGTTILLVEQNVRLALGFSDRAYVLERGTIVISGKSSQLLQDPRVESAYLGKAQNGE